MMISSSVSILDNVGRSLATFQVVNKDGSLIDENSGQAICFKPDGAAYVNTNFFSNTWQWMKDSLFAEQHQIVTELTRKGLDELRMAVGNFRGLALPLDEREMRELVQKQAAYEAIDKFAHQFSIHLPYPQVQQEIQKLLRGEILPIDEQDPRLVDICFLHLDRLTAAFEKAKQIERPSKQTIDELVLARDAFKKLCLPAYQLWCRQAIQVKTPAWIQFNMMQREFTDFIQTKFK